MNDRYAGVAGCYDALCAFGSLGAVGRCKHDALRVVRPGDRVLFAGAGSGMEALEAARLGASVTVVDLSPAMIARATRCSGGALKTECGDILRHTGGPYDVVTANFFLNVFDAPTMRTVLEKLAGLTAPDGRLVIGDVSPPPGRVARVATLAYWYGACLLFRFLTRNAVHPVYDYEAELARLGFRVENKRTRRLCGAPCFVSLSATRIRPVTGPA